MSRIGIKVPASKSNGSVSITRSVVSVSKSESKSSGLVAKLNEDLAREYKSIISYVVHSQVIKGAQYMTVASELEGHAAEELGHAIALAKQIDYLGGVPVTVPQPVPVIGSVVGMLKADLDGENEAVRNYRERVRQAEDAGEYALANQIREILVDEQDHQIDLATALGFDVSEVSKPSDMA